MQSVIRAINLTIGDKDSFIAVLYKNIAAVLDEQGDLDNTGIDVKLDDLQKELLRLANTGNKYMAVADEICKLREMKQNAMSQNGDRQTKRQRIAEMLEFLNSQTGVLSQYDDRLVRRLVERVTILEGKVTIRFKSGVEVVVGV